MIYIVDYGLGNLASIKNMFKHIGIRDVKITSDKNELAKADKIVLPGVGAFDTGMKYLKEYDLIDVLNRKALVEKIPFLGICLGMQLMTRGSEEGKEKGLAWFDADTLKFNLPKGNKVPHMGWNYVKPIKNKAQFLTRDINYRFYFVHSYYVQCNNAEDVLFETKYGINFHSAIQKDNIIGMQFHPEKSLNFGMDILQQFAKL
jgi:imidazole glycerol-phosphate synthase subunit HisH